MVRAILLITRTASPCAKFNAETFAAEFPCRSAADCRKFRCRATRLNHVMYLINNIFSIMKGRFSGPKRDFSLPSGEMPASAPLPACPHHRVAEGPDPGDLDLDRVAMLDVLRGALGPHPHHVAGLERQVLRHPADEGGRPENHVVGLEPDLFGSVDADPGLGRIEIKIGLDPRTHRFESVGVLGAPQGAIVGLPGAFAHIVADRPAKNA